MPLTSIALLWSQFRVRSLTRSLRFYRKLGLKVVRRLRFDDGVAIAFLSDGQGQHRFELFEVPKSSRLYFPIPRSRRADAGWAMRASTLLVERILRSGVTSFRDYEVDDSRFTQIRDPDGYWIELISPAVRPKVRASKRAAP